MVNVLKLCAEQEGGWSDAEKGKKGPPLSGERTDNVLHCCGGLFPLRGGEMRGRKVGSQCDERAVAKLFVVVVLLLSVRFHFVRIFAMLSCKLVNSAKSEKFVT